MEERDLKDYIVKLNDRNIQRQRETGLTLYAIIGAIIISLFYLLDNFSILSNIKNSSDFLHVAVITTNSLFVFTLYFFHIDIVSSGKRITKVFPYQEPFKIEVGGLIYFLTLFIACLLNVYSISYYQNPLHLFYLWLFGIILGLNILSPFIITIYRKIKQNRNKKKGLTIESIDFTFFNSKMLNIISISFLLYALLLTIISFFALFNISLNLDASQIGQVIKYTVIFLGLLFLINMAININIKQNVNRELEEFEKEIFFDNTPNQEIAKRFEQEFAGVPFGKWLNDRHLEIENFFEIKRREFLATDLQLVQLDEIDNQKLHYEYKGRLDEIIKEQIRLLNETDNFANKIWTNFSNLKKFGSLNEDEVQRLIYVQTYLKNNILSFNNQYVNLSNQIAERQQI